MMNEHGNGFGNGRFGQLQNGKEEKLANGLGWFSIGLGLAELIAPSRMAQLIGVSDTDRNRTLLRTYGLRELAAGVGILSQSRPAGWMWSRVAGDVMDLATLGTAFSAEQSDRTKVGLATAAVVGVTVLDIICSQQLSGKSNGSTSSQAQTSSSQKPTSQRDAGEVTRTIIINRPPEEVYRFWRDLEKLSMFMEHIESVRVTGDKRSHWVAKGPAGKTFEWDAETIEDVPNARISWRSLENSDIQNSGTVRFERAPGGRGTLLKVELRYAPPAGALGANLAKLFGGAPEQHIERDLRVLKQILETGEAVRSDASIHSGMHAAQPPSRKEANQLSPSPSVGTLTPA